MNSLKPGMVKTVYERVKHYMYETRAVTLNRWITIQMLIQEGYDQQEVEEAISQLYYPAGLFYEKALGKIALVK